MVISEQVLINTTKESIINITVKASFTWCPLEDRKSFSNSTCYLPISIGGKAHEDKRFMATIKLINRSFKACDLLIADTLHRHTLKTIYPEANMSILWDKSREDGDRWIKRNKHAYEQLTIPYKVIRWDEYLQHRLFPEKLNKINHLYDTDSDYRNAFKINMEQYLARYKNRKGGYDDLAHVYCLEYLKEECAVVYSLIEKQYNFEVYPSQRVKSLEATYKKLIFPFYPNLLKAVAIRFRK